MAVDVNKLMKDANEEYLQSILLAKEFVSDKIGDAKPKLAIVLGSGLGALSTDVELERKAVIPYSEIPHFPQSSVEGHAGELILGNYKDIPVLLMSGRTHYYEAAGIPGYNGAQAMRYITLPIRVMKGLGIESLLLSNAAGGLDVSSVPPELMLIETVINKSGVNPLSGLNLDLLGSRFPPMGGDECNELLAGYLRDAAKDSKIQLKEGVYGMMPGPNYEFTGECRSLRKEGANAVGMSTVPEIIAALHGYYNPDQYEEGVNFYRQQKGIVPQDANYDFARRLKVVGVSLISNVIDANGRNQTDHAEVIENGKKGSAMFISLVKNFIVRYHNVGTI